MLLILLLVTLLNSSEDLHCEIPCIRRMTIVRVPFTAEQMKFVMDMMMKYPKDHVYHKHVDDAFLYDHLEKWHRYALQVEE